MRTSLHTQHSAPTGPGRFQHSLLSPSFAGPKCSYHEKRIYYLEQHVDRLLGDLVPEHLRVAPLLADRIVNTACAV